MSYNVGDLLQLLKRFPKCSVLEVNLSTAIDIEYLVWAPTDGNASCRTWKYFRVDEPHLPWDTTPD